MRLVERWVRVYGVNFFHDRVAEEFIDELAERVKHDVMIGHADGINMANVLQQVGYCKGSTVYRTDVIVMRLRPSTCLTTDRLGDGQRRLHGRGTLLDYGLRYG